MSDGAYEYYYSYPYFNVTYMSLRGDELRYLPPHIHDKGEFLLVERGASTLIAADSVFNGRGRYLIYTPPGCIHEQINDYEDEYVRYCFPFAPEYIDFEANPVPESPFILELGDDSFFAMEVAARAMFELYEHFGRELGTARLKPLMRLFLGELAPLIDASVGVASDARAGYIGEVCLYIGRHFTETIRIDELAERFFVSRSKLTRDFRRVTRLTIVDYIAVTKINKSIPLLLKGMPLSEVAFRSGFSSVSYYIYCFRKWCGKTPMRYLAEQSANKNHTD